MQASDTVKSKQAMSYYIFKINEAALKNPTGDCLTAQCTNFQNCNITFESYELRRLFIEGRNLYWNCVANNNGCGCGR
jgi:hypothetical protein